MITAKINGIEVKAEQGATILEAAKKTNVRIPTLCKHPDVEATAACGICVVKQEGTGKLIRSCCTALEEGMDITTHDSELYDIRKTVIELILSNHPNDCLQCARNKNCELQELAADFGIREVSFPQSLRTLEEDTSTKTVNLVPEKCILCGRCVQVCQDIQDVHALSFLERGRDTRISGAGDIKLSESPCVRCGQCSAHCPTGAIAEYDEGSRVWSALYDEDKYCVVQIAPAVRVALGEAFGLPPGSNVTGKIYAALRKMGFKAVFDTCFSADLTIMEEASEFVERFAHKKGPIPLITTCCPAWVDFMEKYYTGIIEHFSSAKSPQGMLGVLSKTYYPEKNGLDPSKIFMVSIMPCTAKKYEAGRSGEMFASGHRDIDVVLTTRELARLIKQAGIDFNSLPDEEPDHIMGDYTGAGVIFGATGGVMEAALRTAYYFVTGENLKEVDFRAVRGLPGVKETEVEIAGNMVRIAVAHGLGNVEFVINKVQKALSEGTEPPYHFIEVMACPGGCVGGGGQPYGVTDGLRETRAAALYTEDEKKTLRFSHENPFIKQIYKEFLGKPLSKKSHDLLHTKYVPRPMYKK